MRDTAVPRGGRYTRPRRGFRAKSHYPDRLRRRGLSSRDVLMESLDVLRKRQGWTPDETSGIRTQKVRKTQHRVFSGVQAPRPMPNVTPYNREVTTMGKWQGDYDSWLDNHGNPGLVDNEPDEEDYHIETRHYGVILKCGHTVYGTESDIDSGIRKHNDYCEIMQGILYEQENGTGNVSANDEKDVF